MRQLFTEVLISELFILWVEGSYKFGVTYHPEAFFIAIPLYFSTFGDLYGLCRVFKESRLLVSMGIPLGGGAGLLLEWFLVGNSPWNNPAVFQTGQFLFHRAYPIQGYLLAHGPVPRLLWNRLMKVMGMATVIVVIGYFLGNPNLRKLWFLFLPLIVYVGLYYFIYTLGTRSHRAVPHTSSR